MADYEFFKSINTEEKAYWLGFFYANGYIIENVRYGKYHLDVGLREKDSGYLIKSNSVFRDNKEMLMFIPENLKPSFTRGVTICLDMDEYQRLLIELMFSDKILPNKN